MWPTSSKRDNRNVVKAIQLGRHYEIIVGWWQGASQIISRFVEESVTPTLLSDHNPCNCLVFGISNVRKQVPLGLLKTNKIQGTNSHFGTRLFNLRYHAQISVVSNKEDIKEVYHRRIQSNYGSRHAYPPHKSQRNLHGCQQYGVRGEVYPKTSTRFLRLSLRPHKSFEKRTALSNEAR